MSNSRDKIKIIGFVLAAVWVLLLALFWWLTPDGEEWVMGGAVRIVVIVGAVMPLFVIWLAVVMADAIARLSEDTENLRMRLSQLRDLTPARNSQPLPAAHPRQPVSDNAPARNGKGPRAKQAAQQTAMQFDAPDPVEIAPITLILALNFPDDTNDHEAVTALRSALQDSDLARVLRAAQDVITLLARSRIFMDDLAPSPASKAIWRRFAEGERGESIFSIGDVSDEYALEHVSAMLRNDEIFRDSAHHFLRQFDRMLARRAAQLDDGQLEVLTETRSAKAFMLLGKATGIFG